MIRSTVTAVLVTYGAREQLVCESVAAAAAAGVDRVIIVANGYSTVRERELERLIQAVRCDVHVVGLRQNRGSASGFGAGIRAALAEGDDFIWLLDDDNVPERAALDELRYAIDRSPHAGAHWSRRAWVSYRPARGYQRAVAAGHAADAFPAHSSFLYFDLRQRLQRFLAPARPRANARSPQRIPYGPYGGFFAHRTAFVALGMPDEALVLYEDDTEYTSRVERMGGHLFFVERSRIRDSDANWLGGTGSARAPARLLDAPSAARVYYSVRNRVHFDRHHWRGSGWVYMLNKAVYLAVLGVLGCRPSRWNRLRLILRAVSDGERGSLGMRKELPLP